MSKRLYLIAEYCNAAFYTGWHLYIRDNNERQKTNADGDWGWIRRLNEATRVLTFLQALGITIKGDGTCDDDGVGEFAKRFRLGRQRIGGKPRGCMEILIAEDGSIQRAE